MYSSSLKDVAWLERAKLIFLIFRTFVCKFGKVEGIVSFTAAQCSPKGERCVTSQKTADYSFYPAKFMDKYMTIYGAFLWSDPDQDQ